MSPPHRLDTLSLISIQHELAMNVGLSPHLMPMVRGSMKICLRRLSVRRVYLFLRINDPERRPAEMVAGPEDSCYFFMPARTQGDVLQVPRLGRWIHSFFRREITSGQVRLFEDGGLHFQVVSC